jgi:hypothetical protein
MPIVVGKAREHSRRSFKLLIYGRPLTGKTILAASAERVPELSPVLLVDADHSAASLVDAGLGDVATVTITRAEDLTQIFGFLAGGQKEPELLGWDPKTFVPFKTVILDSMTEIHRLCLAHARGAEDLRPGETPTSATRRDFGISLDMVLLIVRRFTQLASQGINVFYTAREKTIADETSGVIELIAPALPGQASDEVGAYADIVGHLVIKSVPDPKGGTQLARVLMLAQPSLRALQGSRFPRLGGLIIAPTMEKLWKRLQKGGEETETDD